VEHFTISRFSPCPPHKYRKGGNKTGVSLNQADFGKKGTTEKCRKILKQGKSKPKGWRDNFHFLGKEERGMESIKKAQAKSAAEKKHEGTFFRH
jgi:hypothetical protein